MNIENQAVVLGTNYYIGLSIVRSLGQKGIKVVEVNHPSAPHKYGKSRYVWKSIMAPDYDTNEKGFVQTLIDYASSLPVKPVLYPSADPFALIMDKYHDELKKYYLFPNQQKGLPTALTDKQELNKLAKKHHLRIPQEIEFDDPDLYPKAEKMGYPVLIKPQDSSSFVEKYRRKALVVNNEKELKESIARIQKDQLSAFVQQIIVGPETNNYDVDVYIDRDGEVKLLSTEYKIRQWPNHFGASTFAGQRWMPEVADFALPFFKAIGYRGFGEMEIKRNDRDGLLYMIEVNVRYVNFTQMLIDLGLDTPWVTYLDMTGQDVPKVIIDKNTHRKWKYLYEDLSSINQTLRTGETKLGHLLREPLIRPRSRAIWSFKDPWPGLKFTYKSVKQALSRRLP